MYTVDDKKSYDEFEEEQEENLSFWQRNKGIIIKIIIIIICIIILILLFKALKTDNRVLYDENVHNTNVNEVRLAAEKYFFINKNLPQNGNSKEITISKLQDEGLVKEIVDVNNKVCNEKKSTVRLDSDKNVYAMHINLNCSTAEKEEVFYYNLENGVCLNCNGKTLMDGNTTIEDNNANNNNTIDYSKYNCNTWSEWTEERIDDSLLEEKTRVLYQGVKYGTTKEKVEYGEWSEWTETPISATNDLEVETIVSNEKRWSSEKTSTDPVVPSETLKIIKTETVSGGSYSYCPSGYKMSDNKCVSKEKYTGNLTYKQYNSGNYKVENKPCEALDTEKDENGNYIWVYKNCQYRQVKSVKKGASSSYEIYTYQELEEVPVTYYRSRTKKVVNIKENDIYTTKYYEENKLPKGYVKVPNSAKVEYAYKIVVCEK